MAIASDSQIKTYIAKKPEPQRFVVNDSFKSSLFRINGVKLDHFVPRYYLFSTKTLKNGEKHYHLRTKSKKTLFMFVLYQTFENFMRFVGFNPNETFEYLEPNPYRDNSKGETLLRNKLLKRLEIKERFHKFRGNYLRYVYVSANFMSNVRELDMGFKLRCYSGTVEFIVNPYVELVNQSGKIMRPQDFVRSLLLTMNYPIILYNFCRKHKYYHRLVKDYRKMQRKQGKYKPYSFMEAIENERYTSQKA